MTPEQYDRIREVFLEAREQAPHQRAAFLDGACATDDQLRTEVERLLTNDDEADTFLQTPALGEDFARAHPESLLTPPASSSLNTAGERVRPGTHPEHIGQYRILDVLGEGGMGVVYRAEQDSPRRTVALKVIKAGAESPEMLKRFEHEGQVLGWLQHPGIAQIFEAGMAESGLGVRPFFAMELVRGQPLTSYVAQRELRLEQRLELLAKVCDAVQRAHQKGVVHRDLKPSNILVDESGQPKVLDFGVARVTNADIRTTTLQTNVGQLVGTIAYMSPEQVAGDSSALDTRSDIYALGVLLYELLTGRVPFDVSRQTIPQAARTIAEEEPTSLSSINKIYRGDIETIVAKALEKDKGRRYQSAAALAADIRRHLSDEPIAARPASAFYQLRKFARRNTALVGGLAATFVVLVIGVAGTSFGLVQATAQRRTAEAQRNRARDAEQMAMKRQAEAEAAAQEAAREEDKAQAVLEFLTDDLLGMASPHRTQDRGITVKQALDAASERIEGKFADEPLVEATIRYTLAGSYKTLAEYEPALRHLKRAFDLRGAHLGAEHRHTLNVKSELALVTQYQGHYDEAQTLAVETLEARGRTLGEEHPDTLISAHNLAVLYVHRGQYDAAEPLLIENLATRRRVLGQRHKHTLASIGNLASLHWQRGRYAEAEGLLLEAVEGLRAVRGDNHPVTLGALGSLAFLYREQGRYAEAEPLMVDVLDTQRRVLGEDHDSTLNSRNNLALLYRDLKRYDEAGTLLVEHLEICRRVLGPEHPDTLIATTNLAKVRRSQGRYDEAEALYVTSLEGKRRVLGNKHPHTLAALASLAVLYDFQERNDEAEPLLVEAVELYSAALGEKHAYTLTVVFNLARFYDKVGRHTEAEVLHRQVHVGRQEVFGAGHRNTRTVLDALVRNLDAQEKYDEAEQLGRELLALTRDQAGAPPEALAKSLSVLATVLLNLDKPQEAEPLLLEAFAQLNDHPDARPAHRRALLDRIIRLYEDWDKPEQAAEWRTKLPTTQPATLDAHTQPGG